MNFRIHNIITDDIDTSIIEFESKTLQLYSQYKSTFVDVVPTIGSICSGFIISNSGYIVTNAHCVCAFAASGDIILDDEITTDIYVSVQINGISYVYECNIVGIDMRLDVAVLKPILDVSFPVFLEWGNARSTPTGTDCYIVGNPLGSDHQSISKGIIRDNRYIPLNTSEIVVEGISTDATSFSGNSGGPILDQDMRVIGILSTGSGESLSIGPSQYIAEPSVLNLINTNANYQGKGYFGIQATAIKDPFLLNTLNLPLTFGLKGYVINAFATGSNSEDGFIYDPVGSLTSPDFMINDVILSVDGIKVGSEGPLYTSLASTIWFPQYPIMTISYVRPPSLTVLLKTVPIVTYNAFGLGERLTSDPGRLFI